MSTKGEINNAHNNSMNGKFGQRHQFRKNIGLNKSVFKNEVTNFPFCTSTHRTFPTMSDPTICYPYMNYPLSFEPMSLPYNTHQSCLCQNHSCTSPNHSPMGNLKPQDVDLEFMSLPCVNDSSNNDMKRRFSDPGLPNGVTENESSDKVVKNLVEQLNSLKDSNHRLGREVQDLKSEVSYLKQQFAMRFYDRDYEPGMLSDIVREIRDAARVREEALLSKVKHMIEERHIAMSHYQMMQERSRTSERIDRLEDQMRNVCLNSSYEDNASAVKEVLEMEQGNLAIRRELQEERCNRMHAEAKLSRLEKMVASFTGRTSATGDLGSTVDDSKAIGNGLDNGTVPAIRRFVSGPVTSL